MTATPSTIRSPRRSHDDEPIAVTLGQLLEVLSELTQDEDEIVATMLHMVEGGRVRLIGESAEAH